jgi:predicted O-methyltransferase YrrM
MSEYPNWFSGAIGQFDTTLSRFKGKSARFLQVGAYTGDCSLWLCENILTHDEAVLDDVDPWTGSMEHAGWNFGEVEEIYDKKLTQYLSSSKVLKHKMTSDDYFKINKNSYDFIYIDGDHTAPSVLRDSISAFQCLKAGGILAFDDYLWNPGYPDYQAPMLAIDAFLSCYATTYEMLPSTLTDGWQVWIQKI